MTCVAISDSFFLNSFTNHLQNILVYGQRKRFLEEKLYFIFMSMCYLFRPDQTHPTCNKWHSYEICHSDH